MKALFAEELAKFKEKINKKMCQITSTNKMLQQHITSFKRSNEDLIKNCEEKEQYGRRLYFQLKGIPKKEKKKSDKVLDHVTNLFDEGKVIIPDAHCVKSVRIRSYYGPHFSAFGLNTERYSTPLRIQSECGKIRTRITPNTGTFYAVAVMERAHRSVKVIMT